MLFRAGVPRGVLSVELASGDLASVVFAFRVSVSEATTWLWRKKSPREWPILIGIFREPFCGRLSF